MPTLTAIVTHADIEIMERTTYGTADAASVDTLCGWTEAWLKMYLFDWTYEASGTAAVIGDGTRYLELKKWCTTITGIKIDDVELAADDLAYVKNHGYMLRRVGGDLWPDGAEIDVTGAFGWQTTNDVPGGYSLMVKMAVRNLWSSFCTRDVMSMSAGDYSVTYGPAVLSGNMMLTHLIESYRLPAVS